MNMKSIILHEVGMRDGLQMEKQTVPMEKKIGWIEKMMETGVDIIQVGSFVHPERVPQMADTDKLFTHLTQRRGSQRTPVLSGLVLNEKGLERGLQCGVDMFCMGVSASETHSRKNTGMSISEATTRILAIAKQAESSGRRVQLSVQSAFGCGYEGPVPAETVIGIVRKYLDAGMKRISLADTAGHATPDQVKNLYGEIFMLDPSVECACHFHNTYGLGLANCYAAMAAGVQNYESSVAGLGGCPFTKIAGGNVCTEDFIHMLHRMGMRTEINLAKVISVAEDLAVFFNRDMSGVVYKTGPINPPKPVQA